MDYKDSILNFRLQAFSSDELCISDTPLHLTLKTLVIINHMVLNIFPSVHYTIPQQ